jgi:hypothetical protein
MITSYSTRVFKANLMCLIDLFKISLYIFGVIQKIDTNFLLK